MSETKPPLPPFTAATAAEKVQAAEDAWNTRDPERVARAYTVDSAWRNRDLFFAGRDEIVAFLTQKWARELDYALRKNLWCFTTTESPCASSTRAAAATEDGGAATATSSGSSTSTG